MTSKYSKLEKLKGVCNVVTTQTLYAMLLDVILEDTKIRYTLQDTENFSKLNKALFGEKYQSDYFKIGSFPANTRKYASNALFFRSIKVDVDKCDYIIDDFWEAPLDKIGRGRLNKAREKMLYIAIENPETAIQESKVSCGDVYMLILYTNTREIEVSEIGWDFDDEIVAFISTYFSKNGNGVYEICEIVAKEVYQFENDGWCYPSVIHNSGVNLCINLQSKKKLTLIGALLIKRESGGDRNLAIFDISDEKNIRLYKDWNLTGSDADKLMRDLDNEVKNLKCNHDLHHKAQKHDLNPRVKAVILPLE